MSFTNIYIDKSILINVVDLNYKVIKKFNFNNKHSNSSNIIKGSNGNNINNNDDDDDDNYIINDENNVNINVNDDDDDSMDSLFTDQDIELINKLDVQNVKFDNDDSDIVDLPKKNKIVDDNIYNKTIQDNTIKFFNYDNLYNFKHKISQILKVNPKHIAILNDNVSSIFINNLKYITKSTEPLYGIPIDYNLYRQKNNIEIFSFYNSILLVDILDKDNSVNIFILDDIINNNDSLSNLIEAIKSDIEILNIVFFSFIVKYFPELSKDEFYEWLINNKSKKQVYDDDDFDLLHSNSFMQQLSYEIDLINKFHKNESKVVNDYIKNNYIISNNNVKLFVNKYDKNISHINTKFIFNNLEIAKYNNLTHVKYCDNQFKILKFNKFIKFKDNIIDDKNIKIDDLILYFSNFNIKIRKKGVYEITIVEQIDIKYIFKFLDEFINPILSSLKIAVITKINYEIHDIDYNYILQSNITVNNFNNIITQIEPLFSAGFLYEENLNVEINKKTYHLYKLTCNILPDTLVYGKNLVEYPKFRSVDFLYKDQKLYINFYSINKKEYDIINLIFNNLLFKIRNKIYKQEVVDYKKIHLRNIDPITFDSNYSRLCQKKYQPSIIKQDNINNLKNSNYVKIINRFTNNEEYYHCPNKKYPYIKFLKGIDNNYCLPCCKQKDNTQFQQYKEIHDNCLKNNTFETSESSSSYIINYSHNLNEERVMKLPLTLNLLNVSNDSYYVQSNKKYFNDYNISIIYILCYILQMEFDSLIFDIIKKLKKNNYIFYTLLDGDIVKYFNKIDDLISTMINIFIYGEIINIFIDWNKIFIEFSIFYNINFIILYNNDGLKMKPQNLSNNIFKAFVIEEAGFYNLIIDHIKQNTLFIDDKDEIINLFSNIINIYYLKYDASNFKLNYINLDSIQNYVNSTKSSLNYCINKKMLCYGVIIDDDIFVPVNNTYVKSDNHSISNSITSISNIKIPTLKSIFKFIQKYNTFIYLNSNYDESILNKYVQKTKQTNKSQITSIPDYSFMGNYIRIEQFLIIKDNIVSVNINGKVMYCQETDKKYADKFIIEQLHFYSLNLHNPEVLLAKVLVVKPNHDYFSKILYYPVEINKILEISNKNYKLDNYINNLYEKNLYKLFISQLVSYYNNPLPITDVLQKIKKYDLDKYNLTTGNLKTNLDFFKIMDNQLIYDKIIKNKTLFSIQDNTKFKYNDSLFVQSCQNQGIFCENKKLIITKQKLDECIKLFLNDIKNIYRRDYITKFEYFDSLNSINNYNSYINENIILY